MSLANLCGGCGQWPQNCTCRTAVMTGPPTNEDVTEMLREALEHEQQTHERLGAILGTDDSLEQCAKRMKEHYDELREFVRLITLQLQKHRSLGDGAKDELFQYAYRMYVKHDVEK